MSFLKYRWLLDASPDFVRTRGPRIKVIHSFYRSDQPSGENNAVRKQVSLLREAGYGVDLIYLESDDLVKQRCGTAQAGLRLATGYGQARPPTEWLANADVLHLHNSFPSISNKWLGALAIPKVISLHNYRAFCANGLFLRAGKRCLDCTTQGSHRAVVHGCYQESRIRTLPIVLQQLGPHSLTHLLPQCNRVLVPNRPMSDIISGLGFGNVEIVPQPTSGPVPQSCHAVVTAPWLFVGRLSPEKGLTELLRIWPQGCRLVVAGDGPQRQAAVEVARMRDLDVTFVGEVKETGVLSLMASSRGLIFPSKAMEGAPLVYGEAMQASLPIAVASGSTVALQVAEDGTGIVFSLDDAATLEQALVGISQNWSRLSRRARNVFQSRYEPGVWVDKIASIYASATAEGPVADVVGHDT